MTEALTGVDRETLLAERAEAEAQLRAAEATLGKAPVNNGRSAAEEEPGKGAQNFPTVDGEEEAASHSLDVAEVGRSLGVRAGFCTGVAGVRGSAGSIGFIGPSYVP